MAFKEVNGATSIDGENFSSALEEGCLYAKPDSEFQRTLGHINKRNARIMAEQGADFMPYEGIESVNLS